MNKLLLNLTLASALAAGASQAQTLVDWSGNYITGAQSISGASNNNFVGVSPTTEYPTTDNSTLAGPAFTAGYSLTVSGSPANWNSGFIANNAWGQDHIDMRMSAAQAVRSFRGAVLFGAAGFANAWDAANQVFSFDLKARINSNVSAAISGGDIRLLVQSGSNYYVSSETLTALNNNGALTNMTQFDNMFGSGQTATVTSWLPYDLGTGVNSAFGSAVTPTFTSIDGVGYVFDVGTDASASTNLQFHVFEFGVAATPVPEPSTYAALLGALALGLVALRRRRG
jgi:hypothetical protein